MSFWYATSTPMVSHRRIAPYLCLSVNNLSSWDISQYIFQYSGKKSGKDYLLFMPGKYCEVHLFRKILQDIGVLCTQQHCWAVLCQTFAKSFKNRRASSQTARLGILDNHLWLKSNKTSLRPDLFESITTSKHNR